MKCPLITASVIAVSFCSPAFAWSDLDRIQTATSLGSVLGSEAACELTYNQDAIGQYIDDHIPADDMQFTPTLNMMTGGIEYELESMSPSQKTAHCRQIKRVARSFGFID